MVVRGVDIDAVDAVDMPPPPPSSPPLFPLSAEPTSCTFIRNCFFIDSTVACPGSTSWERRSLKRINTAIDASKSTDGDDDGGVVDGEEEKEEVEEIFRARSAS